MRNEVGSERVESDQHSFAAEVFPAKRKAAGPPAPQPVFSGQDDLIRRLGSSASAGALIAGAQLLQRGGPQGVGGRVARRALAAEAAERRAAKSVELANLGGRQPVRRR